MQPRWWIVSSLFLIACGGNKPKPEPMGPVGITVAPTPDPKPTDVAEGPKAPPPDAKPVPPAPPADHAPEWEGPIWQKVGVGQKISFGTDVIDQDADETSVALTKSPNSAKFDSLTQTVTWTPVKAEIGTASFQITISQPNKPAVTKDFSIEVVKDKQPAPVAEEKSAVIETLLMIRQPGRLAQINKEWPLDKLLLTAANGFKWQFSEENRAKLDGKPLSKQKMFEEFLATLAIGQNNPRLDPKSKQFDKAAFGDPASWKIVAFRPRIDRQWSELRIVYQAMNAPEPMFAMWRIRPTVEYVPALPRPDAEHDHNNKTWLGMVAKYLMKDGGPNEAFLKDQAANGKAVVGLMNELMKFDASKDAPYKRGFAIGIAVEGRMGGGSARNPDGSYKSGDGWGWSIMKPFQTQDTKTQAWTNPTIPGFETDVKPSADGKKWDSKCSARFTKGDPKVMAGYEVLCRPPLGFVDLPDVDKDSGKIVSSRHEATNQFLDYKQKWLVENFPLDDPKRDMAEENGMSCSQCHIRNFGMHSWDDPGAVDPKGKPKNAHNHAIATLNFQIIPTTHWEEFTLDFLKHQECRAIENLDQYLGPDSHKGLHCELKY